MFIDVLFLKIRSNDFPMIHHSERSTTNLENTLCDLWRHVLEHSAVTSGVKARAFSCDMCINSLLVFREAKITIKMINHSENHRNMVILWDLNGFDGIYPLVISHNYGT